MSFTYNNVNIFYPIGCIIAGLFENEPNGWVFANGQERDNSTGLFNELINLSIGIGTLNVNYTPPNLMGTFLRGSDTNFNLKTFYSHKTQTHTHTATQAAHSHTNNTVQTIERDTNNNVGLVAQNGIYTIGEASDTNPELGEFDLQKLAYLELQNAQPTITINNSTQNVNINESRPFNYGVNWYIKY